MLNRAHPAALAAVFCCYLQPAVYADENSYTILWSSAANYQTGQKIQASTVVELKKGEKLRLEAQQSDEKCTLNGPFKGQVECPSFVGNLNRFVPKTRNAAKPPANNI